MTAAPAQRAFELPDVELAYFEWGEPAADRPTLLFVHATGFHARVWDALIEALTPCHALALEQRGHGRSGGGPVENWRTFGEDVAAFAEGLGLSRVVGIGHSMGGHALLDGAARCEAFARLLLIDPTVGAPSEYLDPDGYRARFESSPLSSLRKGRFDSPAAMKSRLASKGPYPLFATRIFADYCRHALAPTESGDYRLLCDPEVERAVYRASRSNAGIHESARTLDIPVRILRGCEPGAPCGCADAFRSTTWPGLVGELRRGRESYFPEGTHFLPMQMPEVVVEAISEEIESWIAEEALGSPAAGR